MTATEQARPESPVHLGRRHDRRDAGNQASPAMRIPIHIVERFLFGMIIVLGALDIGTQLVTSWLSPDVPVWVQFEKMFDLDREFAFPTWYSIILLATASLLLAFIAWRAHAGGDRRWRYWLALSVIFTAFSIDEQVLGHESAGDILGDALGTGGIFFYAWVIPASVLVLIAGAIYLPFLMSLRRSTRMRFIVAGACYIGGALIMEMVTGAVADSRGVDGLSYKMATSAEEILELVGISLFIIALLIEAARWASTLTIEIDPSPPAAERTPR